MTKKHLPQSQGLTAPWRHLHFLSWKQWQQLLFSWKQQFGIWIYRYWFRLIFLGLALFIAVKKDITIQLSLQNQPTTFKEEGKKHFTSGLFTSLYEGEKTKTREGKEKKIWTAKQKRQLQYVQRFQKTAVAEMERFGIPASITLAQGLLETDAGKSPLATKNNNHFGIKCFSKKCKKGHCSNFSDDSHKDFFRAYSTAWESYRAHSQMLASSKRYKHLRELDRSDYNGWAFGLQKAGYATDKRYAEKLITLIEELGLHKLDG